MYPEQVRKEPEPEVLTVDQAAVVLQVSPRTIRNLIEQGRLRAVHLGGRPGTSLRIPKSEIDRLLRGEEDKDQ
jgi:excisionase family DNA binding protein